MADNLIRPKHQWCQNEQYRAEAALEQSSIWGGNPNIPREAVCFFFADTGNIMCCVYGDYDGVAPIGHGKTYDDAYQDLICNSGELFSP